MKVTKQEQPDLFVEISEMIIEHSKYEPRRGSTFYTKSILEFKPEDKALYPAVENFEDYIGTWETNQYVSSEDDIDWDEVTYITKVERKTVMVEIVQWVEVDK